MCGLKCELRGHQPVKSALHDGCMWPLCVMTIMILPVRYYIRHPHRRTFIYLTAAFFFLLYSRVQSLHISNNSALRRPLLFCVATLLGEIMRTVHQQRNCSLRWHNCVPLRGKNANILIKAGFIYF